MNKFELDIEKIISLSKIHKSRIKAIYLYGSQVYGTNKEDSDYDIIVVGSTMDTGKEIRDGLYNIHLINPDKFKDALYKHEMQALECHFAPDYAKLLEIEPWTFRLDNNRVLRRSEKMSKDSWFKAKVKIRDGDYYRGKKSAFHAVRILDFAKQITEHEFIKDFSSSNHCWNGIKDIEEPYWEDINKALSGYLSKK